MFLGFVEEKKAKEFETLCSFNELIEVVDGICMPNKQHLQARLKVLVGLFIKQPSYAIVQKICTTEKA